VTRALARRHRPTGPARPPRARRLLVRALVVTLGAAAVALLAWLGAHLFTDRSQLARAIAWGDSDVDDWRRFPARIVENAPPAYHFGRPSADTARRYTPALATVSLPRDGRVVTQDLGAFLQATDTTAFLVIKDDVLLYEGYFNGHRRDATVTSFSVAKSFVSALVGIAMTEGAIGGIDDPITRYVPELLGTDPRYAGVTLRHLLTMSSGIRYVERGLPWSDDARTYYGPNLRAVAVSSPIDGEPGRRFHYNNFHPLLLGLVLERATRRPVAAYLEEKIWKPLGMEAPGSWSLDSEASSFEKMESGLNGRAIDFAKFGRLYLNGGRRDGAQLVPASWVVESTRLDATTDPAPHYRYFWWVDARRPDRHRFFAAGKHGQYLYLVPDQRLLIVRFGRSDPFRAWTMVFGELSDRLAAADR
jgi:CubicO group peptidase (beta-lactamase class C family)